MKNPAPTAATRTTDMPRKLQRLLAGQCRYSLCPAPLKDGSDCCEEHDAQKRAQAAVRQAKRRTKLARERLCIAGCGKRVPPSERGRRCPSCARLHRKACADRRESHAGRESVTPASEPKTKLETHRDGYTRVRTIGRGVRGQKSRAELDDDLRADLDDALSDVQQVRDASIAYLRSELVLQLGRIQKREAQSIVADRLLRAARTLASVAEQLCPGRSREIGAVIAEARDD